MAKEEKLAAPATTEAAEPSGFPMTLDEFCTQLSSVDRRVELIGAFHNTEKRAGKLKDLEQAYSARYKAFCVAPA